MRGRPQAQTTPRKHPRNLRPTCATASFCLAPRVPSFPPSARGNLVCQTPLEELVHKSSKPFSLPSASPGRHPASLERRGRPPPNPQHHAVCLPPPGHPAPPPPPCAKRRQRPAERSL